MPVWIKIEIFSQNATPENFEPGEPCLGLGLDKNHVTMAI